MKVKDVQIVHKYAICIMIAALILKQNHFNTLRNLQVQQEVI